MKNSFKMRVSQHHSATCGLCQDTLLRHISQNRMFWYCPSCRQETVCEKQMGAAVPEETPPHISAIVLARTAPKIINLSQRLSINAS